MKIPRIYWALLAACCLFSLVVGYAIGERLTYVRIEQAIVEKNPYYEAT